MIAGPDYGIGIVCKRLGPTTLKGLGKLAAKYLESTFADQSPMFYALHCKSTKLSIFALKHQFHIMT